MADDVPNPRQAGLPQSESPGSSSNPVETRESKHPADSADKKVGWVGSLAQRSTGLPGAITPEKSERDKENEKPLWRLAGLGIQFALTTVLFGYMGHAIDLYMGWGPWCLVILAMLAVIGNLYLLIKEALLQETRSEQEHGEKTSTGADHGDGR